MARLSRVLIFLFAMVMLAIGARADEALNAEIRAAIEAGRGRIDAGQYAAAADILRRTVEDERVPPKLMAQGFLYRGIARVELGRLVAALSDFGNALWLDTLTPPLRAQAHLHRARAYARLARNSEARADLIEATRLAPDDPGILAAVRASGFTSPAREVTAGPIPKPVPERSGAASDPTLQAGAAVIADPPATGFAVQLAALADLASARAEWQRVLARHGDLLAGIEPRYEQVVAADRRLVRLRAGPMATLDASRSLCARLQAREQDCFAVER